MQAIERTRVGFERPPGSFTMFTTSLVQILMPLLIILMMLNTLLLNQCLIGDRRKPTAEKVESQMTSAVALSVVIPYTSATRSKIIDSIHKWEHHSLCQHKIHEPARHTAELVLYVNKAVQGHDHELVQKVKLILGNDALCFRNFRVIGADLSEKEDEYPAGPSNMFFKIFQDPVLKGALSSSTHMFWMEYDVTPMRAGWLDALIDEAKIGDFWIRGSPYLGHGLDETVQVETNWDWVGHINGNALYAMRDDAFSEYLQLVVQYEPPNHYWKPFDVSIWKVLHAFPYTWPLYQTYRSKFQFSNIIHHWGFHVTEQDYQNSLARPDVYLLHGANHSAGNVLAYPKPVPNDVIWNDRVSKSIRLSVMIRSFIPDLLFCREAVRSVAKYIPNAHEIVLVVHSPDVKAFEAAFNGLSIKNLRVIGEDTVMEDQHMQQKWSKLHSDLYCNGDLILHLDSDAVFRRELELRDILWLGKPILTYQRYESLDQSLGKVMWKHGTSYALGDAVHHEFSRNGLRVYPRQLYRAAREHLESLHKMTTLDFLRLREARQEIGTANETKLFSDINYLGAYAWRHGRHLMSLAPMDPDEKRAFLLPPPIISSPVCQGNARLAHNPLDVKILLKALHDAWAEGLHCGGIPDLAMHKM